VTRQGFTLIEMIVVMAIIAILAVIFEPGTLNFERPQIQCAH
jgi:prepilin-type N-terminal cleavage/methylation domain-containing protein